VHSNEITNDIIGDSPAMQEVFRVIGRLSRSNISVLINGESGTGKELVAHALHKHSPRSNQPFIAINTAAIPKELLESELFGHEKGAFTGAQSQHKGRFEQADGGTLFLDEIGEMPLSMQAHLLRVLEEKTIRPVGSNQEIPVDVRIIAASNRNLEQRVKEGEFREDLFFRLNVLNLQIPPLRDRIEDLKALSQYFIKTISANLGIKPSNLSDDELQALAEYRWPGNVRELKNVIERSLLLNSRVTDCIAGDTRPQRLAVTSSPSSSKLEDVEKHHILGVLQQHSGNKSAAARELGISRKTLERKVAGWTQQE
jgi:two-component system NtrC family response regulator